MYFCMSVLYVYFFLYAFFPPWYECSLCLNFSMHLVCKSKNAHMCVILHRYVFCSECMTLPLKIKIQRTQVHILADEMGLLHKSLGHRRNRQVCTMSL